MLLSVFFTGIYVNSRMVRGRTSGRAGGLTAPTSFGRGELYTKQTNDFGVHQWTDGWTDERVAVELVVCQAAVDDIDDLGADHDTAQSSQAFCGQVWRTDGPRAGGPTYRGTDGRLGG